MKRTAAASVASEAGVGRSVLRKPLEAGRLVLKAPPWRCSGSGGWRTSLPTCARSVLECYRAIGYPKVQATDLMAGHHRATLEALNLRPPRAGVVLAVQDTTTLNFTSHQALNGQGPA